MRTGVKNVLRRFGLCGNFNEINGEAIATSDLRFRANLAGEVPDFTSAVRHDSRNQQGELLTAVLACVASVSSRVIAPKLERKQNEKNGRGRGRGEEETLAGKPHDFGKCLLIFYGLVHL